jgi:hypothetical protein
VIGGRIVRALDRRVHWLTEARRRGRTTWVDVALTSPLGHRLPARLHLPRADGPHPAVLVVSGGLTGADAAEGKMAAVSAPALARAGLAALAYTPSGREGAPGPEDRNGPTHQAECAAALEALLAHPSVDPTRVAVLALSFGMVSSIHMLVDRPQLAAQVRELVDWEGPGSRKWFEGVRIGEPATNEAFWATREPTYALPRLTCAYRRFQSSSDHVHGFAPDIGLEPARAAASGVAPRARLNDAVAPFTQVVWADPRPTATAATLTRWLQEATR